jgi:hypothetical protein
MTVENPSTSIDNRSFTQLEGWGGGRTCWAAEGGYGCEKAERAGHQPLLVIAELGAAAGLGPRPRLHGYHRPEIRSNYVCALYKLYAIKFIICLQIIERGL